MVCRFTEELADACIAWSITVFNTTSSESSSCNSSLLIKAQTVGRSAMYTDELMGRGNVECAFEDTDTFPLSTSNT